MKKKEGNGREEEKKKKGGKNEQGMDGGYNIHVASRHRRRYHPYVRTYLGTYVRIIVAAPLSGGFCC